MFHWKEGSVTHSHPPPPESGNLEQREAEGPNLPDLQHIFMHEKTKPVIRNHSAPPPWKSTFREGPRRAAQPFWFIITPPFAPAIPCSPNLGPSVKGGPLKHPSPQPIDFPGHIQPMTLYIAIESQQSHSGSELGLGAVHSALTQIYSETAVLG